MNPFTKAVITSIDTDSGTCKCRGDVAGAVYINVGVAKAVGSNSAVPEVGDRVALWNDNGQLWVVFVLDQVSSESSYAPPLSVAGDIPVSFPGSNALGGLSLNNSGSVRGVIPGDKTLSAPGGGVIAALVGGVAMLRASALCQVILSRVDDVVKIIARNYEKFTESHSVVDANVNGRTYHYEEAYEDQANARVGIPSHKILRGDVEAAEALGLNFRAGDPVAAVSGVISREAVEIPGDMRVYEKDLNKDGSTRERIWKSGTDDTLTETKTADSYTLTIDNGDGHVESIDVTHSHLKLSSNSGACYLEFLPGGTATLHTDVSVSVNTPITNFSGIVNVAGLLNINGGGYLPAGKDLISSTGVTLLKHIHPEDENDGPAHTHVQHNPIASAI